MAEKKKRYGARVYQYQGLPTVRRLVGDEVWEEVKRDIPVVPHPSLTADELELLAQMDEWYEHAMQVRALGYTPPALSEACAHIAPRLRELWVKGRHGTE